MTEIKSTELSDKWMMLMKGVGLVVGLAAPLIVSLCVWLVNESFGHREANQDLRSKLAVLDYKLDDFTSEGPRYTKSDAQLDILRAEKQILMEVRNIMIPLKVSVDKLASKVQNLENLTDGNG